MKMLVPVDGSEAALSAVDHVIRSAAQYVGGLEVHLLNVQLPILSGNVRAFISQDRLDAYYHDEGMSALKAAKERLDAAGIPVHAHIGVGNAAETILAYARENRCDQICMGTTGLGSFSGFLLGSVAARLIHLSEIPVLMVGLPKKATYGA